MSVQEQEEQEQTALPAPLVAPVEWAPVPRVNLLPPEILASRRFRSVQWRLVMVVVLVAILLGGGTYWAQVRVGDARAELSLTQSETTQLNQEQARYAEVPQVVAQLDEAKEAREQALGQDVVWYRFLQQVKLAEPSAVTLQTLTVTLAGTSMPSAGGASGAASGAAAAGGGSDPLVPTGIGTLTVTGTAESYPDVAAWLQSIAAVKGLDASTLQTATRESSSSSGSSSSGSSSSGSSSSSSGEITFTTSVVVTASMLSHRYDRKAS